MKNLYSMTMLAALVFGGTATVVGQEQMKLPKPGPEHEVLKADVGTWDVSIKTWGGPGEPAVTKGKESSRLLGGFWLLTDFQGTMMGLDFKGHGLYGYDPEKKQYVGTWVDSLNPKKMEMIGKHDKEKNTLTYEGMAPGMDGTPVKHVMTTKYNKDGTRVMTMHMQAGDDLMKIFELSYTKAKN